MAHQLPGQRLSQHGELLLMLLQLRQLADALLHRPVFKGSAHKDGIVEHGSLYCWADIDWQVVLNV